MKKPPKNNSLPWWVEILFVQVGLPDYWLRSFLKQKKRIKLLLSGHAKNTPTILIIVIAIIYLFPLVKQANSHNKCIKASHSLVSESTGREEVLTNEEINAYATNFCNGGSIN